jgi:hypothetical protein
MAKKKPLIDPENVKKSVPEFKPGDKPYCQFGKEVLNQNVPWDEILSEISMKGYPHHAIALEIGTELETLQYIEENFFDKLSFRAGARMISMHYRVSPECYLGS